MKEDEKYTLNQMKNIFSKYLPADVIESDMENPDTILSAENINLSVMVIDVQSFTSFCGDFSPQELVATLNRYYTFVSEHIYANNGEIDKYIGGAVMAWFAPETADDNCSLNAVSAASAIIENLDSFNGGNPDFPPFKIGIGINHGCVIRGNMGSNEKIDYTIIGDQVNLAFRTQSLTKAYDTTLLFTSNVRERIKDSLECILIDTVAVKGKTDSMRIYTLA